MNVSPTQSNVLGALRSFLLAVLPAGVEVVLGAIDRHYVYVHCRPCGEPFYVGKGCGRRGIRLVSKNRNPFHQAIVEKYGADKILVQIFACSDEEQAYRCERLLIASLRRKFRLANFHDGGEGGTSPSAETRAKQAAAKTGRKLSVATRDKISRALRGRPKDPAHIEKVSIALKGRPFSALAMARCKEVARTRVRPPDEIARRATARLGQKPRSADFRKKMSDLANARVAAGTHNFIGAHR